MQMKRATTPHYYLNNDACTPSPPVCCSSANLSLRRVVHLPANAVHFGVKVRVGLAVLVAEKPPAVAKRPPRVEGARVVVRERALGHLAADAGPFLTTPGAPFFGVPARQTPASPHLYTYLVILPFVVHAHLFLFLLVKKRRMDEFGGGGSGIIRKSGHLNDLDI